MCRARCLCEFCGNQRSIKAAKGGAVEADYLDLINFESSTRYNDRQKAALAYAEAITWDLPSTTPCGPGCTSTSPSRNWSRSAISSPSPWASSAGCSTLDIEHHQILAGTDGSMAPGFEDTEALKRSKSDPNYWAKKSAAPRTEAAE